MLSVGCYRPVSRGETCLDDKNSSVTVDQIWFEHLYKSYAEPRVMHYQFGALSSNLRQVW